MTPGRYARALHAEVQDLLEDYVRDEWDVDTAAETPVAIKTDRARSKLPPKRSGEYLRADVCDAHKIARGG